jgi:hypothetical protein
VYSRSSELPRKTLIIDTLNAPGVALIDPSKPQNLEYIDTDKKYKLFFGGKGYDLRDQAKIAEIIQPKTQTSIKEEPLKISTSQKPTVDEGPTERDSLLAITSSILKEKEVVIIPKEPTDQNIDQEIPSVKFPEAKPYTPEELEQKAKEVDLLTRMLVEMADENVKEIIHKTLTRSWQVPPSLLMLQTLRLAKSADSLGMSTQLIDIFTQLLDAINENSLIHRQYRHISTTNQDEYFFFNLQRIKRDASPGLAQIIDNAIISDPYITSFVSLWKYLSENSSQELKHYLSELVSLLAKHSIEGYFNLTEEQKESVFNNISSPNTKYYRWVTGGILASFFIFILLFLVKRFFKNRKKPLSS